MKRTLILALISLCTGAILMFFIMKKTRADHEVLPDTELIQQQMKNVSKLVVNEAKISQIYNYKDQKSFMNIMTFDKKALVVVNADIQILYDLSKLTYVIDEVNKVVKITYIPKEEITINPDIKIYDVEASRFNAFEGSDYNTIQESVKKQFREKILKSKIEQNAKNRLVSELGKFLVVTQSLGWTLQYDDNTISDPADFSRLIGL